jgi:hypothetical protein
MGAPDGLHAGLRETTVLHFAFLDQLLPIGRRAVAEVQAHGAIPDRRDF